MPKIYYQTFYHAIWSTKKRIELIDEHINMLLKQLIHEKSKELKGMLIECNSYLDHCHALLSIPPKISASDFIGQLKGFSSYEINKIMADVEIKWQRGFGVITLSAKGMPLVKRYIQNQEQHHKNNELIDILEYIPDDQD